MKKNFFSCPAYLFLPLALAALPCAAVFLYFGPGAAAGVSVGALNAAMLLLTVASAGLAAGFAAVRCVRPALRRALAAAEAHARGDFTAEARPDGLVREGAELVAAINAVGETARKQAAEQAGARRVDVAAGKALDSLLAGLSHDVRHPLNRVVGASYLALRCRLDPGLRGCFENIYAAAVRLQKITGAVLELSRLNAGKLCAPRKPVSQAEITAEIRRHLSGPDAPARAREDASGPCPEQPGAGDGCDSPAEVEDVPLRRALVVGWDGRRTPAASPGMSNGVSEVNSEHPAEDGAGHGLSELFPATAALLEEAGFSAAGVEDVGAAGVVLEQASAVGEPFDLLLLDRHVPDAADMETLRDIGNNPSVRPRPLILMLSAYGGSNIRRQAEEAGADAFLHKPIRASVLRAAVQTLTAATGTAAAE
ncbi:MAG: response regulator [Desulfovibrio sp.]|nr:response regulator [Desulfovibrio sp.]